MRQAARRVQALERRPKDRGDQVAIVMGIGKPPQQIEREVAELRAWLPAELPVLVIDR